MRLPLVLACLLWLPAASADPLSEDCGNDGVFVQVGPENSSDCHGVCTNRGVWVSLGLVNQDDCGSCENDGLYVQAGGGCGRDGPEACADDLCVCVDCPTTMQATWCTPVVHGQNVEVYCGEVSQPCSVVTEPDCWAVRLACFFLAEPLEKSAPPGWTIYCPRQP